MGKQPHWIGNHSFNGWGFSRATVLKVFTSLLIQKQVGMIGRNAFFQLAWVQKIVLHCVCS